MWLGLSCLEHGEDGGDLDDGEDDFYCVTGPFNEWDADRMEDGNVTGLRTIVLDVPRSGTLEFRFLKNGEEHQVRICLGVRVLLENSVAILAQATASLAQDKPQASFLRLCARAQASRAPPLCAMSPAVAQRNAATVDGLAADDAAQARLAVVLKGVCAVGAAGAPFRTPRWTPRARPQCAWMLTHHRRSGPRHWRQRPLCPIRPARRCPPPCPLLRGTLWGRRGSLLGVAMSRCPSGLASPPRPRSATYGGS